MKPQFNYHGVPLCLFQQADLWDKASLVSADDILQFYVNDLQPFIKVPSTDRPPDGVQPLDVADTQVPTRINSTTLCGSTQLVADLAELAAEAGNVTLPGDFRLTQTCMSANESAEIQTMANEHSEDNMPPSDDPIALDGFCLQSSSVSFMRVFRM